MKYPILYESNETDFFSLGLGPLKNTIKATVTEERNGAFYLEAEILTDEAIFPLVLDDCLIKADAGHLLKDQRFRIKRIVPKHNGRAEIYAEHVSYLAEELTLRPEVSITGTASSALTAWKGAIVEPNPFVVDSDISRTGNTKWRIDKVENPRQALGGPEGSLLDTYGGEYRFDNYHISLLEKRGTTANTVLAYGRNITDFEQERNIANTYTSIVPYAIYTDDNEQEITVTVDGYKVNSQYAGNYPNHRSLPVNFSDKFSHDEIPTKAKLQQLAEQYISDNEVGVPKTSIRVSFLDLSKSADYAEYKHLEEVNLCDDVRVVYPKLGVNTVAKVIRVVWNVLTESYDEIEIGEKRTTLATKINEQSKEIKEINNQTNYALISADGKNIVFYGLYGQDGLGEPTATKVGDSWYKPDGEFTELYIWNGTIWEFIMSTKENHEIRETIEGIEDEIVEMTGNINTAVDNANQAVIDANFAKDQAETAATLATNANQSAQDAVSQSSQAHQLAVQSATDASTAFSNAQTAMTNAQNALNKSIKTNAITYAVSTSQTTVPTSGWQATVPTASSTQYVWTRTSVTLQDDSVIYIYNVGGRGAQGVKGDTGAGGANAPKITAVKPQFYLSTSNTSQAGGSWSDTIPTWVEGRHYWVHYVTTYDNSTTSTSTPTLDTGLNTALVTSLQAKSATETLSTTVSQHATQIEARALKTTVNTLTGRVDTAEGSITANATAITQRATKSSVDTLTGRVSTAEGQISTQAGQIAQRLTASEVNSLVDGKGYATTASVNSQVSRIDGDINSWNSQLQTVQATVDGIEIGGRNLILNSEKLILDNLAGGANKEYGFISVGQSYMDVLSGTDVVISFDLEMVVNTANPSLSVYNSNNPGPKTLTSKTLSFVKPVGGVIKERVFIKTRIFDNVSPTKTDNYIEFYSTYGTSNFFKITKLKLEEDLATVTALTTSVNQINQSITDTNNSIQLLTQTVTQNGQDISSISADLTVADGKITGLTSKTDGHTTQIGSLESSFSGLQSTVSQVQTYLDGKASVTALSSLQQTVNGIQTTVANKAEQSEVTQLAGQITSVVANKADKTQVTQLSDMFNISLSRVGAKNYVVNSEFESNALGWDHVSTGNGVDIIRVSNNQWDNYLGSNSLVIKKSGTNLNMVTSQRAPASEMSKVSFSVKVRLIGTALPETVRVLASVGHYKDTSTRLAFHDTFVNVTGGQGWVTISGNNITLVEDTKYVALSLGVTSPSGGGFVAFSQPMISVFPSGTETSVLPYASDTTNYADFTMTPQGIRLKGKLIYLDGETYITNGVIKTAHIADLAVSGAKIANASISSAKIISLDASKITAGTINTSLVNVIATSGNKRVQIKGEGLSAIDANGKLRLAIGVQDIAGDGQSDPSNILFYTGNGTRSFSIGTNVNDTLVIGTQASNQFTLIRTPQQIALESNSVRIVPPNASNGSYFNFGSETISGTVHPNMRPSHNNYGTIGSSAYQLRRAYVTQYYGDHISIGKRNVPGLAQLDTGYDSLSGFVRSWGIYDRTYSASSNIYITTGGHIGRAVSARKYKTDIQIADSAIANAKKVLDIQPVTWLDKAQVKRGNVSYRNFGMIADEFHELGLTEVVEYGADGQVEGLGYDRISMYHNVILSEHEQSIKEIRNQNLTLLGEVQMLRNEVESLRQLVS